MKQIEMMRTHFKILLLPLLAGMLVLSCDTAEEDEATEQNTRLVAVETITLEPDNFDDYIRLTGSVEALDDATVASETQGQVQFIAERGAQLDEGDEIARLDNRLIRSQYESAQTSYQLANNTYQRLEPLHADSIISTQDFDNARAQRDQAKAQLEQAEKQLEDSSIKAPFTGRVEERLINTGEFVSPGLPVARLVNAEQIRIVAGIPERYSGQITEGTAVRIELRDVDNTMVESVITYAGQVIDPETRTYTVEIELDNTDRMLKPDMVVDLQVKRRQIDGALIIPRTAVLRSQDGANAFKAVENNGEKYAQLVSVNTGEASGALIEVVSGLEESDEVVISGMSNLNDGDRLNILNTETSIERAEKLQNAERPFVSY
ncbi:MAG: efflux RND transporter periplasmic adaptor subunit [Balneolaceae bacterium]